MIVSGRVRVAVRLRPRNSEEMRADADFVDCVELQPEVKPYIMSIWLSSGDYFQTALPWEIGNIILVRSFFLSSEMCLS